MIAKVVVGINNSNLGDYYEYIIPKYLEEYVFIGSRVLLSFGFQDILGYVIEINETSEFIGNLKEIKDVCDYEKELTNEQVELALDLSENLNIPQVASFDLMIPSFLKETRRKYLYINNYNDLNPELAIKFGGKKRIAIDKNILEYNSLIKKEIAKGNLQMEYEFTTYGRHKKVRVYSIINDFPQKSGIRNQIIELIKRGKSKEPDLRSLTGCSRDLLNRMVKDRVINYKEEIIVDELDKKVSLVNNYQFTIDQENLLAMYYETNNKPFLLCSNDEVFIGNFYLDIIIKNIKNNKHTVFFAPNIMVAEEYALYFESNLKEARVCTYHSKNTKNDNYDVYMNVKTNNYHVLVTTSLGLFLPYSDIGTFVVIDEDNRLYINDVFPNCDLRVIAYKRALKLGAKLIYSSSTPSINLFYKTRLNKVQLLEYKKNRVNKYYVVDMKKEVVEENNLVLSKVLIDNIRDALKEKKISMLIVNNKAFATMIKCRDCQEVRKCPKCNIPLTYYKNKDQAKCSYCDYKTSDFKKCNKCGSTNLISLGFGLEQVYQKLSMAFPFARIMQVDSDTTKDITDYHEVISAIEENEVDIIIGTNFLTKSFKYDNIKVVGLLYVDSLLNLNDHRASEYTFDLIAKATNKEVLVVQTYYKDHYAITCGVTNDYDRFYEREILIRERLNYEPFYEINKVLVTGPFDQIYHFANYLKVATKHLFPDNVLGPTYDYQTKGVKLIIKHNDYKKFIKILNDSISRFKDKNIVVSYERYPKGM